MTRTLTEQKVLKRLGIPDFRHMTKDKVIKFASMLHKMDPEVAQKALEQFPEFAHATTDIVAYYRGVIDKGYEANATSQQMFYAMCDSINETLKEQLEDGELSFEEKMVITDKMMELARMVSLKDSENKNLIKWMTGIGSVFGMVVLAFLANGIGGQAKVTTNSLDDDLEDDTFDIVE